jgi:hypothetical protein
MTWHFFNLFYGCAWLGPLSCRPPWCVCGYLCSAWCVYYARNCFPQPLGAGRETRVAFCAPSVKRCQSFCLRAVCRAVLSSFLHMYWRSVREKTTKGALHPDSRRAAVKWIAGKTTIDFLAKHKLRSLLVSDSVLELMRPALCPANHSSI